MRQTTVGTIQFPQSAAPSSPPLLICGSVIFISDSGYGVSVASAVGWYVSPIIFQTSLISALSSMLILLGLPREFDRPGGNGQVGCFKSGLGGMLYGSLGWCGGCVIEFGSTCFADWPRESWCTSDCTRSGDGIPQMNQTVVRLLRGLAHADWNRRRDPVDELDCNQAALYISSCGLGVVELD